MPRQFLIALLTAVFLATPAFAPTTMSLSGSAQAQKTPTSDSINLNSSRSNVYRLDPNDRNAAAACVKGGGTVSTQKGGRKVCSINYNASKSNTGN